MIDGIVALWLLFVGIGQFLLNFTKMEVAKEEVVAEVIVILTQPTQPNG